MNRLTPTPDYQLIRFEGYLDIARYPEYRDAFTSVAAEIPVLVDLTATTGVDSTVLSELLLFKRRHHAVVAVVIAPEGQVAQVFRLASIGDKLQVYTDLSDAIAALGVRPARGKAPLPE